MSDGTPDTLHDFPPGDEPECPKCGAPVVTRSDVGRKTLMSVQRGYDDDGNKHTHDPNWTTTTMECENGHTIERSTRRSCPVRTCDFGGESEMTVVGQGE